MSQALVHTAAKDGGLEWYDVPSPNYGNRRPGAPIDMLLIHYTGMPDAASAIARLIDEEAAVSCHWLIEEDGTLWRLVPESERAWHAGSAFWAGETDINSRSVGIELVNPGHELGYRPFPMPQMERLAALSRAILARHPIPPWRVLGHSDVAPGRKRDPGELFDWAWLAREGVGLWPAEDAPGLELRPDLALEAIGYKMPNDSDETETPTDVLAAFQSHWCQSRVDGWLDAATRRRIGQVAMAMAELGAWADSS